MNIYKKLFMDYMDKKNVRYTDKSENAVVVTYNGDNMKSIPVTVFFDKDGDPLVQFDCFTIASFKGKATKGYQVCNALNAKYRWVKFYIDSDEDIICECDLHTDERTCGAECLLLVHRIVDITDESYNDIMRAIYA